MPVVGIVIFPLAAPAVGMGGFCHPCGGDGLGLLVAAGTLALSAAVLCSSGLFYRRPLPELVFRIIVLFAAAIGGTLMPMLSFVIAPLAVAVLMHRGFRLGGAVGVIGCVAERQDLRHQIFHFVGEQVVFKLHIAAVERHSVSFLGISDSSGQEKLVSGVFTVAVGHVHQVVFLLQADDVPHMRRTAVGNSVSNKGPYCGVAGCIIKSAQVAEVLEGFGIALTHYLRVCVIVKYIYYLPGVAVQAGRGRYRITVVIGERAYPVLVLQKLFVIIEILAAVHNILGSYYGLLSCGFLLCVYRVAVVGLSSPSNFLLRVGISVTLSHQENHFQAVYGYLVSADAQGNVSVDAALVGFAQPIQLIGHIRYQAVYYGVYI